MTHQVVSPVFAGCSNGQRAASGETPAHVVCFIRVHERSVPPCVSYERVALYSDVIIAIQVVSAVSVEVAHEQFAGPGVAPPHVSVPDGGILEVAADRSVGDPLPTTPTVVAQHVRFTVPVEIADE